MESSNGVLLRVAKNKLKDVLCLGRFCLRRRSLLMVGKAAEATKPIETIRMTNKVDLILSVIPTNETSSIFACPCCLLIHVPASLASNEIYLVMLHQLQSPTKNKMHSCLVGKPSHVEFIPESSHSIDTNELHFLELKDRRTDGKHHSWATHHTSMDLHRLWS